MDTRKLGGIVVAGNENDKAETIRILANAVIDGGEGELISTVVGEGMLANADAIAETPAYMEAVEVLALRLVDILKDKSADEDEDEDELEDELEDEDEGDETDYCARCGCDLDENEGDADWIGDEYVCYNCMTAREFLDN